MDFSKGGYTALACLTDSKVFSAGISLYGISDMKLLAGDTHKVSKLDCMNPNYRLLPEANCMVIVPMRCSLR